MSKIGIKFEKIVVNHPIVLGFVTATTAIGLTSIEAINKVLEGANVYLINSLESVGAGFVAGSLTALLGKITSDRQRLSQLDNALE